MDKRTYLYRILWLTVIFALLHFVAQTFYFYWTVWWFDILMHFLAGVVGGFATFWVLFYSGIFWRSPYVSPITAIALVLTAVMVVGLGWEVMEYVFNMTDSHEGYPTDPIIDLFLDGMGSIVASLILLRKKIQTDG